MKHVHLLIKPSSGMCNLNCRYCFYRDITEKREIKSYGFMNEKTLEQVIVKALSYAQEECTIAFQGGEPTLIGLEFFQKTVDFVKTHNKNSIIVNYAIQTNGIGLDRQWADFFRENHFLVGISLDGTKDTHDCNRIDFNDNGTFSRVMKTIQLFQDQNVEYNILTVVNRKTAKKANKIYNFYKKNKLQYLQFIPCLDPFGKEPGQEMYSLSPQDYGVFLNTLFDLWYQDVINGQPVYISQSESYIEMILGFSPKTCGMSGICGYQHIVEADGSVYPCDFYVTDEYCLGNLTETDFENINQKRQEIHFIEDSSVIESECKACDYYRLCRGGCRRYRFVLQDGTLGRNYFCESYKIFFSHTYERINKLALHYAYKVTERKNPADKDGY
ncbi:MAG: anaerobic sulfatase maturase [Eubacterium sp.]